MPNELLAGTVEDAGMTTRIDNFGNLIGHLQGMNPALPVLMMGSHLDSQPYGGRFDGVVFANELLDNLPFGIAQYNGTQWNEARVGLDSESLPLYPGPGGTLPGQA